MPSRVTQCGSSSSGMPLAARVATLELASSQDRRAGPLWPDRDLCCGTSATSQTRGSVVRCLHAHSSCQE
jgi:hypothetical protein